MRVVFFFFFLFAATGISHAQPLEEIRLGIAEHNICVISDNIFDCDNANKESGPNITGELVFSSPKILSFAFKPRPMINASYNTSGNTSYAGFGLLWAWDFADRWSFEPSFGLAVHDGVLDNPFDPADPRRRDFDNEVVQLGSEVVFRTGLAINRDLGENWGVQLQYEHLSHGQILAQGTNQGLDNFGLRVYWRLK